MFRRGCSGGFSGEVGSGGGRGGFRWRRGLGSAGGCSGGGSVREAGSGGRGVGWVQVAEGWGGFRWGGLVGGGISGGSKGGGEINGTF